MMADDAFSSEKTRDMAATEAAALHLDEDDDKLICKVHGPLGAPAQEFQQYENLVLVGSGIGITPFASILKHILSVWTSNDLAPELMGIADKIDDALAETEQGSPGVQAQVERLRKMAKNIMYDKSFKPKNIHFHWITREHESLHWFGEEMNNLASLDTENRVRVNLHLSSVKVKQDTPGDLILKLAQAVVQDRADIDIISGISNSVMTQFGRPSWDDVFARYAQKHRGQGIGVFACGPQALTDDLERFAAKYTNPISGTFFHVFAEHF